MSASNTTDKLGLNSWIGSDRPQRSDFNSDNEKIDEVLGTHIEDNDIHITSEERRIWNKPYFFDVYQGNGAAKRAIDLPNFIPTFGFIFSVNTPLAVTDFTGKANYNYFAIVTRRGSTAGVTLSTNHIFIDQSAGALVSDEYLNLNVAGHTYCYLLFR